MDFEVLILVALFSGLLLGAFFLFTLPGKDWLSGFEAYARYFGRPL